MQINMQHICKKMHFYSLFIKHFVVLLRMPKSSCSSALFPLRAGRRGVVSQNHRLQLFEMRKVLKNTLYEFYNYIIYNYKILLPLFLEKNNCDSVIL